MAYFNEATCQVPRSTCSIPRIVWYVMHNRWHRFIWHVMHDTWHSVMEEATRGNNHVYKRHNRHNNNHVYWNMRKGIRVTLHLILGTWQLSEFNVVRRKWHVAMSTCYVIRGTGHASYISLLWFFFLFTLFYIGHLDFSTSTTVHVLCSTYNMTRHAWHVAFR